MARRSRKTAASGEAALLQVTKRGAAMAAALPSESEAHILKCAMGLFAEKGYAATTVRDIGAKAGATAPMINYYFNSKDELYRRIASVVTAAVEEHLARRPARVGFWDSMRELISATFAFAVSAPEAAAFFLDALYGARGGRPRIDSDRLQDVLAKPIAGCIRDALASGELRLPAGCTAEDLAEVCIAIIQRVMLRAFERQRVPSDERSSLVENCERLLVTALSGAARESETRRDKKTSGVGGKT